MTAAGGRRAWRRWLLGALGLAGALAAAMTAHAHSGGGLPNPATNVSVNFATGRVDFTYGHCQDVDDFQYRFASSGAWDSYNPTDGCYDGFTGPRSAYCTVSAITGQDYVEARIVTNQDPPHCEGDSVHSPVIAYARTTLATNRATLTTANLNGATLTVTLGSPATTLTATAHATFGSGVGASGFELVTTPSIPGLSFTVGAVTAGSRTATLTLATGSNFVSPPTSVAVRVKAAAHSGSTALTSKALPVRGFALRVGPVSGLVTEGGGKATFTVALNRQPTAAVTVSVSSLDASEGTVAPSSLTFSTGDWNTAQTVTVTGVDDALNDGDVAWQVRLDPSSGDTGYNALANVDVDVTTLDDDLLRAGALSGLVTEGGGQATFPVVLTRQPTAAVTVSVSSLDTGEGTVAPSSLTFSTGDWNTAQTVTVTGVDDTVNDGHVTWQVRLDPSSGDTAYNGLVNLDVDVTTLDDDLPEVSQTRWGRLFGRFLDVTTTGLLGAAARQSVALTFIGSSGHAWNTNKWRPYGVDACEWWEVEPELRSRGTSGTCHELKSIDSGSQTETGLTVDVTPTPTMLHHRGVVIRVRNSAGLAVMTEWVPLAAPALVLSPASVSEGGGVATVTATLSDTLGEAVTVTVAAAAVPPAVAADFTLSSTNTLTLAAGETTSAGTVTVTAVDNTVDAPDKTVTVSATARGASLSPVALAIPDDELLPKAALALTPSSVTENGGVSTVTATLSHPSSEAVTLTVATAAAPPAVAGDFTQAGTTLTIAPGATTSAGLVTVTAVDNAVSAADKTVTVSATAVGGRGVAAPPGVALTLRDDEAGLTEGAVSGPVTEAGGQATFTVALLTRPTAAVTVAVTSRDTGEGTVEPSSLTFSTSSWSTAQTVTVTGVQDPVDDGDVTWQVRLDPSSVDSDYNAVTNVDVDVTTTDDDGPPGVTLALDPSSIAESGAGNVATVTARLAHPSGAATTVAVAAASGVFTVGAGAAGVVVVAAGDTTSTDTATVTAVDDDTDAPDRTATVTATVTNDRATTDGTTMAVTGAALTVRDDDAAPGATLALDPASIAEPNGVSTVSATLSRPSSQPSTVTVTAVAGAYTVGTDATIVIAAGATTAASDTVLITAVNDDLHHGNAGRGATVTAALTNGQGAGAVTGAALTITDDENLPTASLLIDPLSSSISENGGIATVTAQLAGLSGKSSEATTVTVTVTAVASSGAVAGDFTQTGTTLTIAAGSLTSTGLVTITGVDNNVDAANKLLQISATAAGGHGIQNPGLTVLTLTDDDAAPTAALVLMPASISENGGIATVTATLTHPTSAATTLTVAATAVSPAVAADFTLSSTTTLTLAAGATTSTGLVTVTAVDNTVASGSKQVRVSATASGGRGVANPANATLALRDDDYGLLESAVSGQATEAGGTATFTVVLRSLPTAAVTVAVTSRDADGNLDESEGTVAPSSLVFLTTSWNAAQTVTVTGADDAVDDGTVTWAVRLDPSSGDASYDTLSAVDVPVTTTDDDTARAALVLTPASILESGEVSTVTATLSHATTEAVTLTVAAAAGSGAVAADFTLSTTTTLTLATGATTSTGLVTVTANDNAVASADKSVTVSATAASGRGLAAPADATLTLRDDEATADVNGDGAVNANDGLLMYYAYTFETVFKLNNDLGQRVRGFLRTLRGAGSPAADDAGYKAMLQAAWDWRSANPGAGDVNGDGAINANDGLLMYYAYTFEAVFKLNNDLGRRVRGFLRTLRSPTSSHPATDAGYKAMLQAAWGLR